MHLIEKFRLSITMSKSFAHKVITNYSPINDVKIGVSGLQI